MAFQTINIDFPFKNSANGSFVKLNSTDQEAIKADLMHLILTNKGERLYMPDFGTNLRRFIFEQNDTLTLGDVKNEISTVVGKYLPNLQVNEITVDQAPDSAFTAIIRMDYTITEDVFETQDFIIVQL